MPRPRAAWHRTGGVRPRLDAQRPGKLAREVRRGRARMARSSRRVRRHGRHALRAARARAQPQALLRLHSLEAL
ncbi:hypothetical protein BG60_32665 [Caballeronia zhejiangensis]|uniref:Uncharacterized protein n=1 Tax=Caballeronia zhejiangensis TaxID=871203 RepID=A0A656QLH0_9BURK|nr:hypothetical protein BG60_32665 [Caballeronia zhejiangensis]